MGFNLISFSKLSKQSDNLKNDPTNIIKGEGTTSSLITSDLTKIYNQTTRDYYRGKSFNMAGEWSPGVHYFCDEYVQDWVSYGRYLLACKKNHLSNEPPEIIFDEYHNPTGVKGDDWEFIIGGGTLQAYPFIFIQETPSSIWYIQHDLYRNPTVVLQDNTNERIIADIVYIDNRNIKINFSEPVSGMASLF